MHKQLTVWLFSVILAGLTFADVQEGDAFPAFKIPTLDGKVLDTAQLTGRVLYVDFWASWCTTCKESFPILSELNTELQGTNVFFLGINTDEDVALANKFLLKTPVNFLNVSDRTQKNSGVLSTQGIPDCLYSGQGRHCAHG